MFSGSTRGMAETWRPLVGVGLACLFFGYGFLLRVSPSVMVNDLMRDFAVGATLLGNLSAIYLYVYAALQIPIGVLLDRLGARPLLAAACLVVAAGSYLFATSETISSAYLGRFLIGVGCAFRWPGLLAIIGHWFATRFALFTGFGQVAGMAGGVLAQAPLAAVVGVYGWRQAVTVLAAVGVAVAVSIALFAPGRLGGRARTSVGRAGLRHVMQNPQTWWAAVFGLAMTGPILAFAGLWGVPFVMTVYGAERTTAAGVMSLMFVGSGLGAVLLGWWSDRIGRRKPVMLAGSLLCAAMLMIALYAPNLPLHLLSVAIFLLGVGGSSLLFSFAVGREHNTPATSGRAIGIINMAVVGSGALFQPLIGLILDSQWTGAFADGVRAYSMADYRLAMGVLPAAALGGIIALVRIKETYCRQISAA